MNVRPDPQLAGGDRLLQRLRVMLAALDELLDDGACAGLPAELSARLRAFAQLLGARLAAADPLLVWRGGLDALAGCLGSLTQELRACANGDRHLHQASAEAFLDQAHAYLGALPTLGAAEAAGYLAAFVAAQRDQHSRLLGSCAATLAEVQRALVAARAELDAVHGTLSEARAGLDWMRSQLDTATARVQAETEHMQAGLQQRFDEQSAAREAAHDGLIARQRSDGVQLLTELRELIDATRRSVDAELEHLAARTPTLNVASSFGRCADDERRIADRLRFVAVCFLASAGVLAVVFTLFAGEPGRLASLQVLAVRIGGALLLALPGCYAAFESARHRRIEARHRKSELDLHALDPVLRGLSPEKRERMREQITERIFNRRSSARGL